MHGLGNDFIVLDLVSNGASLTSEQIRQLADRHYGIGFDQLLQVEPPSSPTIDFNYRIFNADGDEVEHCGNGARCLASFIRQKGLSNKNPLTVKTVNRVLALRMTDQEEVTVDMSQPIFKPEEIPFQTNLVSKTYSRLITIDGHETTVEFCALSMGNPHAVIIAEDLDKAAVKDIGEGLGNHCDFLQGVNVGFMQIISRCEINLRVYERGAGETLACGTGACAAMVAGCLLGALDDTVKVNLRGGHLIVEWRGEASPVLMTGPVSTVYEGTIEL